MNSEEFRIILNFSPLYSVYQLPVKVPILIFLITLQLGTAYSAKNSLSSELQIDVKKNSIGAECAKLLKIKIGTLVGTSWKLSKNFKVMPNSSELIN